MPTIESIGGPRCRGCERPMRAFIVPHDERRCVIEHGKWHDPVVRGGPSEPARAHRFGEEES